MIPPLLDALLRAPGPSGQEAAAARVWRDWCAGAGASVGADDIGSSWARLPGNAEGLSVAVAGHIDEIGVHVTHIDDKGFLRFGPVGGWDTPVLVGQRVVLSTKRGPVVGVVARKPFHLLKDVARKKAPETADLHIDVGAASAEEARTLVRIGDMGVIDAEPIELPNGRVASRAIDNRVGCYVAARALELAAAAGGAPGDVLALAVVQEETSFGGARTSAFRHDPDVAIVVDLTFETDQPGVDLGERTAHPFGSGPSIARGTMLHPGVFELLAEAAEAEGIAYTISSYGSTTTTDADAFHLARAGIPTALVEVPARYMHSPVEMVSLDDVEAAAQLIAAFARRLQPGTTLAR